MVTFYLNVEDSMTWEGFRLDGGDQPLCGSPAHALTPAPLFSAHSTDSGSLSLSGNTVQIFICHLPSGKRCFRRGESNEDRMFLSLAASLLISRVILP